MPYAGSLACADLILWYGLLTDQFQITYIWNSSERSLPAFYKFAAIWGGQAGSLLFWTLLLSLFSTAAALTFRNKQRSLMPFVNATLLATLLFFLTLLVFSANPFEQIGIVPSDGRGLNPLLQNYWMVIHPVMLYLGWVGLTVPFAFAVAALSEQAVGPALGADGTPLDADTLDVSLGRHHHGQPVGIHGVGLGRILGMGPGRECQFSALADRDRIFAQHNHSGAARHPEGVERHSDLADFHTGNTRHVHHKKWYSEQRSTALRKARLAPISSCFWH